MLDLRDAAVLEELRRAGDQESFYHAFVPQAPPAAAAAGGVARHFFEILCISFELSSKLRHQAVNSQWSDSRQPDQVHAAQ
ncbi:MAG: hypothetical protein ACJ8D9_04245 [Xanthobacteraceae bacterium]